MLAYAIPELIEGSAFAIISGAFIVTLRWMLIHLEKSLRELENAQHVTTVSLLNLQQLLLAHDLTATGLNMPIEEDFDERHSKALSKYQEVQKQIDEVKLLLVSRVESSSHN